MVSQEERIKIIMEALKSQVSKLEECYLDRSKPDRLKNVSLTAKGIILSASVIDELSTSLRERSAAASA